MTNLSPEQPGAIFTDEALRAFSFLQQECGYGSPRVRQRHEGMSNDFTEIRYESKFSFVRLFYAHMESDISLTMGLLQAQPDFESYRLEIGLEEALSFAAKDVTIPAKSTHPYRLEPNLHSAIAYLASVVCDNLLDALRNPNIISQWTEFKKAKDQEDRIAADLAFKRKEAQNAWEKKDYQKVISIYGSFADRLSDIERKRLRYATKQG